MCFRSECYGLQGATVVGFVGKVVPWHGVDTLLRVAPELLEKHPELRFLIVGETSGHGEIQEIVESLGISSAVRFTGQIPHTEVPAHIAAMDIAVMPSSNDFGSPVKIFEYMAMARAILAPQCGPVEEVLEDGKTALIVSAGNPSELVTSIRRLAEDAELRRRLGTAAREIFLARHTWECNTERTIAILQKAISRRR